MRVGVLVLGVLCAIVVGLLALFTVGEAAATAAFVVIIAAAIAIWWLPAIIGRVLLIAFPILAIAALAFGGYNAFKLAQALTDSDGPSDPADAAALASAQAKLDAADQQGGFRIELTEEEVTAYLQDGLADEDTPIRRVTVDVVGANGDDPGEIQFDADFKNGDLSASGAVSYGLEAGGIDIKIKDVDVGAFSVPGAVRGALEDLVDTVLDVNETLDERRATVQLVELTDTSIIISGTQAGGDILTSEALLSGLRENAEAIAGAVTPPPEQYGAGDVNAISAPGDVYYVALGDSLAENVGVTQARDGYVSRFHSQLQQRNGATYGLQNFGDSGETSGTMIRGGQLDAALDFIGDNDVAYITVDIGANDLLGHLGSPDCGETTQAPACAARIDASLASYRENLTRILGDLRDAAPDATIVFLETYNPFSFGFQAVGLEQDTDEAVQKLNAIVTEVAAEFGVLVADGFTPMRGTTGATTHMTDSPPDIHPKAIGYDILTGALVQALP